MAEEILNEIWIPVFGYEGYYEISSDGRIRGITRKINVRGRERKISGRGLKQRLNNCGYLEVRLSKNGETKTRFVHVLKATAFIPNPEKKPFVNHLNGEKTDLRNENLEWSTHSENILHAYKYGLCNANTKMTPVIDICTNRKFQSIKEAALISRIPYSTCKLYLSGRRTNTTCLRILDKEAA